MPLLKSSLFRLLTLTVVLAFITLMAEVFFPGKWIHDKIWHIILFFAVLTTITGVVSEKLMKREEFNSVSVILAAVVFRLLCSIGFVFLILWQGDENILWFVVDFFMIYLLYLLFDIYGLITNLRLHSK
jgi:O-antigen/teichoic acid export membrane protein